jgi:hypothetical protein
MKVAAHVRGVLPSERATLLLAERLYLSGVPIQLDLVQKSVNVSLARAQGGLAEDFVRYRVKQVNDLIVVQFGIASSHAGRFVDRDLYPILGANSNLLVDRHGARRLNTWVMLKRVLNRGSPDAVSGIAWVGGRSVVTFGHGVSSLS